VTLSLSSIGTEFTSEANEIDTFVTNVPLSDLNFSKSAATFSRKDVIAPAAPDVRSGVRSLLRRFARTTSR